MGLKQSQSMKTTLGTTMTPELQQAVKLLQMSVLELQQEVTKALEENPTLEEVTPDDDHGSESHAESASLEAGAVSGEPSTDQNQIADPNDPDFQNFVERGLSATSWKSTRQLNSDDIPSYEQVLTRPATLQDHLNWQLRMSTDDEKILLIGEEIIGNINEDGYLVILLEEIADRLKVDLVEVEAVLYRIQRFDPPGVAARELKECLLLQAEALKEDDALEQIIEHHLPELENKNYVAIAKALNLSKEYVIELCKVIHSMEPKPGRAFVTTEPQYFVPDVYVIKVGGDFVVVLNEDQLPRLRISKPYQQGVSSGEYSGEVKSYVKDKLKGAMWLMKSIYHRQRTIYRATQAILKRQLEFFEKGPQHLRPMVLKDIAEDLGLHESTISRVTNNKYVHTPHGIFELKYFFNSGIASGDGGEDFASESVKQKIKELIAKENPKDPLSDQTLVDMLSENNIKIARRTVAKYREALNILPSNKRKKFF